jgi:hypothetical protein
MQAQFGWDVLAAPTRTTVACRITPCAEGDGDEISELALSPDTKSIASTRRQRLGLSS